MATNAPSGPRNRTPVLAKPAIQRATPRVVECTSPRILVVEDDEDIARSLSIRLTHGGFEVSGAATMEEALEQLASQDFDAAILDKSIPGGDGIELLARIRSDSRTQKLPVIILTASMLGEHEDEAMAAGASAFMHKPFDSAVLMGELEQLVHRE